MRRKWRLASLILRYLASDSLKQLVIEALLVDNLADIVRIVNRVPGISTLSIGGCSWVEFDMASCIKAAGLRFGQNLTRLALCSNLAEEPFLRIAPPSLKSLELGRPMDSRSRDDPVDCFEGSSKVHGARVPQDNAARRGRELVSVGYGSAIQCSLHHPPKTRAGLLEQPGVPRQGIRILADFSIGPHLVEEPICEPKETLHLHQHDCRERGRSQ
ncbi:hypothetical protein OH77DRAFT_1100002 [Trametes cingulata]|nr:hypothetical protein OH77DRAFT_1100002 [Trametes cingulata]